MYGLTPKEIIQLRLKCLEPFITIASKTNIEQDTVIKKAHVAWKFATELLQNENSCDTVNSMEQNEE